MQTFQEIVKLIEKTRKDCAWDREQTIKTLKKDFKEEYEEVIQAIDNNDTENLKEEIGDVFWTLTLMVEIAKEEKKFDMQEILTDLKAKIVRRHPHVFGDKKAETADEAVKLFNEVKENEKALLRNRKQA